MSRSFHISFPQRTTKSYIGFVTNSSPSKVRRAICPILNYFSYLKVITALLFTHESGHCFSCFITLSPAVRCTSMNSISIKRFDLKVNFTTEFTFNFEFNPLRQRINDTEWFTNLLWIFWNAWAIFSSSLYLHHILIAWILKCNYVYRWNGLSPPAIRAIISPALYPSVFV